MITNQPTKEQINQWETALGRKAPTDSAWICKDGVIVCFFNYTGDDIELSVVGDGKFITREFVTTCFMYTFNQLNCHRCTARVAMGNEKALRMDAKLGFKVEGRLRQALNGEDIIILGMLRSECRWV